MRRCRRQRRCRTRGGRRERATRRRVDARARAARRGGRRGLRLPAAVVRRIRTSRPPRPGAGRARHAEDQGAPVLRRRRTACASSPVEREVPFGEGTLQQAQAHRRSAARARRRSRTCRPSPAGTTLRAIYLDAQGQAFVDLSREVAAGHPGGALDEILTVYSIVNAVTDNLPAVHAVQILVDGREVDTLAGHVDLRRPLRARHRLDAGTRPRRRSPAASRPLRRNSDASDRQPRCQRPSPHADHPALPQARRGLGARSRRATRASSARPASRTASRRSAATRARAG